MVSGRPLLYLSLPGVVFILGVYWYRRRNKNRSNGDTTEKEQENLNTHNSKESKHQINGSFMQKKSHPLPSDSVNINNKNEGEESPTVRLFGKSAPIKIVQNCRGSPVKQQQVVDSEVLKNKIQSAENKVLRSIDEDFENLSSPVDLPDSVDNRIAFYSRNVNCKSDAPVVIRATRTPKISPENSFLENKYTKECEENNNLNLIENVKNNSNARNQQGHPIQSSTNITLKTTEQSPILEDNFNKENAMNISCQDVDITENGKRNVDAASPSLSLCSVQSGDSGKGSSLPRSEANRVKSTYEFFLPNSFIGHLYGKKHFFINQIKVKTSANVLIRKTNYAGKLVCICIIEGSESEIEAALTMIRQRLPTKRFPNFTMNKIQSASPQTVVPLSADSLLNLQLKLIENINNDVIVTAVVNGAHMFVQHPLHPSHPSLTVLQKCLYDSYTLSEAPLLPGIEINAVCVLPVKGIWYRVQIVEQDAEDKQRCVVKFLDFGGYMNVHFNELRQIRSDFMSVPFQATECVLSNVEPIDSMWSSEAVDVLCQLTRGIVLQAQVAGYNSHNIPEIYLYAYLGPGNIIFINRELEARNLAKWVELRD
ncbi:A-kinase anchor protein 1, mitochondrial isoform X3 [Bactrocera dorsalis]|nr:A-kinase anchor protein 1, mitochondrial isoform X1 [Bactrocera dorsalis]XP_049310761.1 A-kinase anchor protein 1, mitochondrial isoform X3 [Bactrocera dorsalis]XP_049310762.1 A-kinase anchor protein 1, mitochondrial isoform X3 [Bactrocera dorsalis]XP_049310763.1 A-kinase anchor protein 1, mitochondrial isoform X3 [Bactrocera dorsalis]